MRVACVVTSNSLAVEHGGFASQKHNAKFGHDSDPHHTFIVCLLNSLCDNLNGLLSAGREIVGHEQRIMQ